MLPSRAVRHQDLQQTNDGAPLADVLDAMRSYTEKNQIQKMLHVLLTRLLENQPLDPFEFLIQTLQKDDQLDALDKKVFTRRFDLRRESTKKHLVLQLYRRLQYGKQGSHGEKHLAREYLTSQLRLNETRCYLQKSFPSHYRDLIGWFTVHEDELPSEISADQFTSLCMQVLRAQASE